MNVGTEVEIAIGHRLMDYEGLCAHPHGHNYRIVVKIAFPGHVPQFPIPGKGMYVDFKDLRSTLNSILEPLDHAMMLRDDDPLAVVMKGGGSLRLVLFPFNPTAENFAMWVKRQLEFSLGVHPQNITVRVYETSKSYAEV